MVEFKRILVPLDGSLLAEKALPMAAALSRKFDSVLILLHVFNASAYAMAGVITNPEGRKLLTQLSEQARRDAERYLSDQREALGRQGLNVRILLHDGAPAKGILEVAKEGIDLIVMASHGRSGLARWAYGSVADRVVRYSPCPVLLVRQEGTKADE